MSDNLNPTQVQWFMQTAFAISSNLELIKVASEEAVKLLRENNNLLREIRENTSTDFRDRRQPDRDRRRSRSPRREREEYDKRGDDRDKRRERPRRDDDRERSRSNRPNHGEQDRDTGRTHGEKARNDKARTKTPEKNRAEQETASTSQTTAQPSLPPPPITDTPAMRTATKEVHATDPRASLRTEPVEIPVHPVQVPQLDAAAIEAKISKTVETMGDTLLDKLMALMNRAGPSGTQPPAAEKTAPTKEKQVAQTPIKTAAKTDTLKKDSEKPPKKKHTDTPKPAKAVETAKKAETQKTASDTTKGDAVPPKRTKPDKPSSPQEEKEDLDYTEC